MTVEVEGGDGEEAILNAFIEASELLQDEIQARRDAVATPEPVTTEESAEEPRCPEMAENREVAVACEHEVVTNCGIQAAGLVMDSDGWAEFETVWGEVGILEVKKLLDREN